MRNRAKQKLQAGKAIIGAAVGIADPDVSEGLAHMGFGPPLRWDEPPYVSSYDRLVEAAHKTGKAAGAFTNELDRMPWLVEKDHRALMVEEADAFPIRGARAAPDAERQGRNL